MIALLEIIIITFCIALSLGLVITHYINKWERLRLAKEASKLGIENKDLEIGMAKVLKRESQLRNKCIQLEEILCRDEGDDDDWDDEPEDRVTWDQDIVDYEIKEMVGEL